MHNRSIPRRAAAAGAVMTVLLTAACGSTVQSALPAPGGDAAAGGDQAATLGQAPGTTITAEGPGTGGAAITGAGSGRVTAPSAAAAPTSGTAAGSSGGSSAAWPSAPAAPSSGAPSGAPAGSPAGAGSGTSNAPAPAPAVPAAPGAPAPASGGGPLSLGFINTDTSNAGEYGVATGQTYTSRQVYEAVVAALNDQGGLAGRPIDPVFATTDTGSTSWSNDYQAACSAFTEDNHVAAVLGYTFAFLDSFEACLSDAGVAHLNAAYEAGDAQMPQMYPYLVNSNVTTDRRYRLQLEGAVAAGRLTPDARIGVITGSCPHYQRGWQNGAQPYVDQVGLQVIDTVDLGCPGGTHEAGAAAAQISNAVLRFRTNNVDTVHTEGIPVIVFAAAAESQGYYPTYVLSSTTGGAAIEPNAPPNQMRNMYGYGWFPGVDVNLQNQPPRTAPQQRCLDLLESKGLTMTGFNDFVAAYTTCDPLFLYEQALTLNGGNADPAAIVGAISQLGSSYTSALSLDGASFFDGAKRDAPAHYREFAFNPACSCFQYGVNAGTF